MQKDRSPDALGLEQAASDKAFLRIVGFLFVLQMVNYLDRSNISFAALSMNRALGLSATTFGLIGTMFYVGYILCEIPSNLILARVGARRWIARIVFTWGLATILTSLAVGPMSLGALRTLVGVAEAGFLPGVMLYLTYWFPASRRGKATAVFLLAQQVAAIIGSIGSVLILQGLDGNLGLAGWQWLFILTGLPAVVLGVAVWYFLPDTPAMAPWLNQSERNALQRSLAREETQPAIGDGSGGVRAVLTAPFVKLCIAYFCIITNTNTVVVWQPLIIRSVLGDAGSLLTIGALSAVPSIAAVFLMPMWAASSDRRQERIIHYAVPVALAVGGWALFLLSTTPVLRLIGVAFSNVGSLTGVAILWTMPASILPVGSRPVGIGIIATVGIAGALTCPAIIGVLRDLTGNFDAGIWYSACALTLSIAVILTLPSAAVNRRRLLGLRP